MMNLAHVDHHIYRSGAPTHDDLVRLQRKLGLKTVISLDESSGKRISRTCRQLGIEHIMLPIDMARHSSLLRFLHHDVPSLLRRHQPVLIHCLHGKDRTGLACALYRAEKDRWSYQRIMREANSFGFGLNVEPKLIALYDQLIRRAIARAHGQTTHGDDKLPPGPDSNAASDIVDGERGGNNPSDNLGYTLDAWERASFAPLMDPLARDYGPAADTAGDNWPEQYDSRQSRGLSDAPEPRNPLDPPQSSIPQIGQSDDATDGLGGAGPSTARNGIVA